MSNNTMHTCNATQPAASPTELCLACVTVWRAHTQTHDATRRRVQAAPCPCPCCLLTDIRVQDGRHDDDAGTRTDQLRQQVLCQGKVTKEVGGVMDLKALQARQAGRQAGCAGRATPPADMGVRMRETLCNGGED